MSKITVVKLTGEALDALRTGGVVLLTYQNNVYGVANPAMPPVRFPRPTTQEGIEKAWEER